MLRPLTAATVALLALTLPAATLADKPAHAGKGHGKGKHTVERVERRAHARQDDVRRAVRQASRPVVVHAQAGCPPGLAKKNPACVPPGQARKHIRAVGDSIDWDDVHVITRPGLYGLGVPPSGQRYAIVDGRLVRVDRETGRILSVVRMMNAILD